MLKKMRMWVILSAVLAFFVVIALVSILVNVINYRIVTEQADRLLQNLLWSSMVGQLRQVVPKGKK